MSARSRTELSAEALASEYSRVLGVDVEVELEYHLEAGVLSQVRVSWKDGPTGVGGDALLHAHESACWGGGLRDLLGCHRRCSAEGWVAVLYAELLGLRPVRLLPALEREPQYAQVGRVLEADLECESDPAARELAQIALACMQETPGVRSWYAPGRDASRALGRVQRDWLREEGFVLACNALDLACNALDDVSVPRRVCQRTVGRDAAGADRLRLSAGAPATHPGADL